MPRECPPLQAGTLHLHWSTLSADWADRSGQSPWMAVFKLGMAMGSCNGGDRDFIHARVGR
jgi:hypothetical protein